jgi:hypothetical protein
MARCRIIDAKLDPDLYAAKALMYATHVHKRSPMKYNGSDLKFIRRFGSICFALIDKSQRENNLGSKAVKCILLGTKKMDIFWRQW